MADHGVSSGRVRQMRRGKTNRGPQQLPRSNGETVTIIWLFHDGNKPVIDAQMVLKNSIGFRKGVPATSNDSEILFLDRAISKLRVQHAQCLFRLATY